MARMTGDFWDKWSELDSHFQTAADSAPFVTSSFYPDLDMLPIGWLQHVGTPRYSSFSLAEQRTLMTQWSIARAPLIWGGAASADKANATTLGLIANAAVLGVGKNSCGNKQLRRVGSTTGSRVHVRMYSNPFITIQSFVNVLLTLLSTTSQYGLLLGVA